MLLKKDIKDLGNGMWEIQSGRYAKPPPDTKSLLLYFACIEAASGYSDRFHGDEVLNMHADMLPPRTLTLWANIDGSIEDQTWRISRFNKNSKWVGKCKWDHIHKLDEPDGDEARKLEVGQLLMRQALTEGGDKTERFTLLGLGGFETERMTLTLCSVATREPLSVLESILPKETGVIRWTSPWAAGWLIFLDRHKLSVSQFSKSFPRHLRGVLRFGYAITGPMIQDVTEDPQVLQNVKYERPNPTHSMYIKLGETLSNAMNDEKLDEEVKMNLKEYSNQMLGESTS